MKIRISSLFLFLLSAVSLGISLKLFYNMALFADASNAPPQLSAAVTSGSPWIGCGCFCCLPAAFSACAVCSHSGSGTHESYTPQRWLRGMLIPW